MGPVRRRAPVLTFPALDGNVDLAVIMLAIGLALVVAGLVCLILSINNMHGGNRD